MAKVNYTEEQTEQIKASYEAGIPIEDIAEAIGKTVRSVRSKLVREGVYVAEDKPTYVKETGLSKKEIIAKFEELGFENSEGLLGATKPALQELLEAVIYLRDHQAAAA